MRRQMNGGWARGATSRSRFRSGVLAAAVAVVWATSWPVSASAAAVPAAPQAGHPLAAASSSATANPTTITKQPESAGPGNPRVAQTVDRVVTPVSRSSSSDSAVTYSSDGQTTVASLSGDVTFDVDSSALTDRAKQVLDEIVKRWNGKPPATVGQAKALTPAIAAMSLARCRSPAPIAHDAKKVRRFIVTPPRY